MSSSYNIKQNSDVIFILIIFHIVIMNVCFYGAIVTDDYTIKLLQFTASIKYTHKTSNDYVIRYECAKKKKKNVQQKKFAYQ